MTLFRARPVVVLLAVFALLGAVFAVTTPLFEASDELWHYPMVQQLSGGGPLPVQDPANVGAGGGGGGPPAPVLLPHGLGHGVD